jgi:hypothetical protein
VLKRRVEYLPAFIQIPKCSVEPLEVVAGKTAGFERVTDDAGRWRPGGNRRRSRIERGSVQRKRALIVRMFLLFIGRLFIAVVKVRQKSEHCGARGLLDFRISALGDWDQPQIIGALPPHRLHKADALLPQNALNTANSITLAVEQKANSAQQIDVFGPVIAPPAASLQWFDLREATFPKPQDMLRHVEVVGDLADSAKGFRSLI